MGRFLDHPEGSDASNLLRYLRLMNVELSKQEKSEQHHFHAIKFMEG
jgi:hypothetical protein